MGLRDVDRHAHGRYLKRETKRLFDCAQGLREEHFPERPDLRADGTIIVLEGEGAAYPLKLESLSRKGRGSDRTPRWLLLTVHETADGASERAVVWVADKARAEFLKVFEDYLDTAKDTRKGNPRYQQLVTNISRIRSSFTEDLWTSSSEPPRGEECWWELWLDADSPRLAKWTVVAKSMGWQVRDRELRLGNHLIVWVRTTWEMLRVLPSSAVPVAEIRRPAFIDTVEDLLPDEQLDHVLDLVDRITPAGPEAPAVCHLDTGVLRTHRLLHGSLDAADQHSIFAGSGTDVDPRGHGTAMAGLGLYGDMGPLFSSTGPVVLRHRLESVRMMPGAGEGVIDPVVYGAATADAVSRPEVARPDRSRAFCLTLTTAPDKPGDPTLWSASVDALSAGTDIGRAEKGLTLLGAPEPERARLIIVAAGNLDEYGDDYRERCEQSPIQDPAQAWNALTVGAFTERVTPPANPTYRGWEPLAPAGDISPHTTTSCTFESSRWPIKPDICMEGGNVLSESTELVEERAKLVETELPVLSLQTTGLGSDVALTSANATSAATAQAARLAALTMSRYPGYWPETVRGLLTHSAEWTDVMSERLEGVDSKRGRQWLLRQFGWGVPREAELLNSSAAAVTLVTQDEFTAFAGKGHKVPNLRLHKLPWPREVLRDLGDAGVRLRVTLSYFVEPSASRRGWRSKYSYASHGLRFDMQGSLESGDDFVRRLSGQARGADSGSRGDLAGRWFLGARARHLGSLHQDQWTGTGAELAHCNHIAVYPVGGWWKANGRSDRVDLPIRYSLIVSLRTEEEGVDLYTPIANQLQVPVAAEVSAT